MTPSDWKDIVYVLALIFVLGMILLLIRPISEGFTSGPIQCGIDSPCPGKLKCLNGFCADTMPLPKTEKEPVPLLAPGEPAPYF